MRWRLLDRIGHFAPWESLRGRKAVSFEEYSLLKPFGRKGELPESLLIGTCMAAAQWLTMASSEFEHTCLLSTVETFVAKETASMADVLDVGITVATRETKSVVVQCEITISGRESAGGQLTASLVDLHTLWSPAKAKALWETLYAKT